MTSFFATTQLPTILIQVATKSSQYYKFHVLCIVYEWCNVRPTGAKSETQAWKRECQILSCPLAQRKGWNSRATGLYRPAQWPIGQHHNWQKTWHQRLTRRFDLRLQTLVMEEPNGEMLAAQTSGTCTAQIAGLYLVGLIH